MQTLRKSFFIILLANATFCHALPEWITNNTTHIAWSTISACAIGATYFVANNNSNNRYAYLEQQAQRDEKAAQEQKASAEQAAIEKALDILQPFRNFIEKFHSIPAEQLAKNKEFEQALLMLVRGHSSNPQFLDTLNETIAQRKNELYTINNPDLMDNKKRILEDLNFILLHANNSTQINKTQQENTLKRLELERAQHMHQASAELEKQAQIETASIKKICSLNEQTAEEHAHTSRTLHQTAQNMSVLFHRATINLEGQLDRIGNAFNNSLSHGFEQLSTWQSARAQEHAETRTHYSHIASLIPALVNALNAAQQTINNQGTQLNQIEEALNQTKEAAEAILANLPADSRIALEKHIARTAHESEQRILRALAQAVNGHQQAMYAPSAPPMEERPEFEIR